MNALPIEPPLPQGMRRLLVVGGTFDPPRRGHVRLARDAAAAANCDHLLFIPAHQSPLKENPPTPAKHRLAMLRLAAAREPAASITTIELDRSGASYTVDTLRALRAALPTSVELRLFLGSDQLRALDAWREAGEIARLAPPVVVLRPPDTLESLRADGVPESRLKWIVPVPADAASSTEVRRQLERGGEAMDLVEPPVMEYIRRHHLYGSESS